MFLIYGDSLCAQIPCQWKAALEYTFFSFWILLTGEKNFEILKASPRCCMCYRQLSSSLYRFYVPDACSSALPADGKVGAGEEEALRRGVWRAKPAVFQPCLVPSRGIARLSAYLRQELLCAVPWTNPQHPGASAKTTRKCSMNNAPSFLPKTRDQGSEWIAQP